MRKFELFYRSKIWLLLLTSSVVKKLSDNLNWIDKSSSGTYHKYALCTRVWKVAAKTGTALCNRHFSKTPWLYISQDKVSQWQPRRWSLESISTLISTLSVHRGMIISAQFCLTCFTIKSYNDDAAKPLQEKSYTINIYTAPSRGIFIQPMTCSWHQRNQFTN